MRNCKRMLALLLTLALCLTGLPGAAEAGSAPRIAAREDPAAPVRVIVRLEGEPAAAQTESTRSAAAVRIAVQHAGFRGRLAAAGIECAVDCDYGLLLNGMALTVSPAESERLAALPGVRSVHRAVRYDAPSPVQQEAADAAAASFLLHRGEARGSGTVIAVLDTGITAEHEVFGVYPGMLERAKLTEQDARTKIAGLGYGSWLSQKIPFAYDYCDQDDDASDDAAGVAGHGTHVAGIAAGYAVTGDGAIRYSGAAPDAQLLAMKLFSSRENCGTDSAVCFKALEDACLLGADVINLSLGSPSGFTHDLELETELFGDIYQLLREQGIAVAAAAGNDGSMAEGASNWGGSGCVTADYADYGVLSNPASCEGNLAAASAESDSYPIRVLEAGGREIRFYDTEAQFFEAFCGSQMEYTVVPGYGRQEDYQGLMILGRIALVSRGEIDFQEKLSCAARAGAAGLLVYNNEPGELWMELGRYEIPAAAISAEDGAWLISLAELQTPQTPVPEYDESGEDLGNLFGRVTRQEELVNGTYLIVNERAGVAFSANQEEVNDPGNYLPVEITEGVIDADPQIRAAALLYDGVSFSRDSAYMSCGGTQDEVRMSNDTPEDLQITVEPGGAAEIVCRRCGFRYHPEEQVFRFYLPGSELRTDPRAQVVLYRKGLIPGYSSTPIGELSFPDRYVELTNAAAGRMSDFSSMGVTPDLRLKPTLSGLGGRVCSALYDTQDGYTVKSGTSMAAPYVAGSLACVLESLAESQPALDAKARMELAQSLLTGTARLLSDENGVFYSPRKQGNGLADPEAAAAARICVSDPVLSLGDTATYEFVFMFPVRNLTEQTLTYQVDVSCLRDAIVRGESGGYYNTLRSEEITDQMYLAYEKQVVIPAGEESWVAVYGFVDQALQEVVEEQLPNGFFVDGFVTLRQAEPACDGGEDCPGARFRDMPRAGSWSHPGVDFALRNNLFNGTGPDTFKPKGTMDRAMMVTVLYALAGRPETEIEERFSDVSVNKYYAKAVTWASQNGVVSGYSDGTFRPKRPVTREQMAVLLMGYARYAGASTGARADLSRYPDLSAVHSYAREAMRWAVAEGILAGVKSNGVTYLKPQGNATREQVATILMGFLRNCVDAAGEAHASFTAFCGDWKKAPILESHDWREIVDADHQGEAWDFELNTDVNHAWILAEGHGDEALEYRFLGDNPYDVTAYDPARSVMAPGGVQTLLMQPMLLRNARHLIMTVTDAETGALYAVDDAEYVPKACLNDGKWFWQPSRDFRFDGVDAEGKPLPGGTKLEVRFYASPDYGTDFLGAIPYASLASAGRSFLAWSFPLTVDDAAPEIRDLQYDPEAGALRFTASDDAYLAYAELRPVGRPQEDEDEDPADDQPVWTGIFADDTAGVSRTFTVEDLAPGEYTLTVCDYADNRAVVTLGLGSRAKLHPVHFVCPAGCAPAGQSACYATEGACVTLPGLAGVPGDGRFIGWLPEALPGIWTEQALQDAAMYEEIRRPGEAAEIYGECWYYAMLQTPLSLSDPEELVERSVEPLADYSGVWAFGGCDPADGTLYFLDSSANALDMGPAQDRVEEPDACTLFTVTRLDDGYQIAGENGDCLSADGGKLSFVPAEAADGAACWEISRDETGCLTVRSLGAPGAPCLVFDSKLLCFRPVSPEELDSDCRSIELYGAAVLEFGYLTAQDSP